MNPCPLSDLKSSVLDTESGQISPYHPSGMFAIGMHLGGDSRFRLEVYRISTPIPAPEVHSGASES